MSDQPDYKKLRRKLRKNMTAPERKLWRRIRKKQLGAKFRRQHQIKEYIVDFYCPQKNLVIEIDGDTHYANEKSRKQDKKRDKKLNKQGIKVLRFTNSEVMKNIRGVLKRIKEEL